MLFDKVLVLQAVSSSHTQKIDPSTSFDKSFNKFEFETYCSRYLHMHDIISV